MPPTATGLLSVTTPLALLTVSPAKVSLPVRAMVCVAALPSKKAVRVMVGVVHEADERTAAHIFQILMAGQYRS
jgi:hypothetical protein